VVVVVEVLVEVLVEGLIEVLVEVVAAALDEVLVVVLSAPLSVAVKYVEVVVTLKRFGGMVVVSKVESILFAGVVVDGKVVIGVVVRTSGNVAKMVVISNVLEVT